MSRYGNLDRVVSWLAIGRGKRSRRRTAYGIFDSEARAQAKWSGSLGHDEMVWTYEIDRPRLKVSHDGFVLATPQVIKSRDVWLKRYRSKLSGFLPKPTPTTVLTFATGMLKDPLAHACGRWNGSCTLPTGMNWPMCAECEAPLAYVCTLDFRRAVGVAAPKASLIVHVCPKHWYEANSIALTWVAVGDKYRVVGDDLHTRVATEWRLKDFDVSEHSFEDLERFFPAERSLYFNFVAHGTKLGGLPSWVQNGEAPVDREGKPMDFIAQVLGGGDVEMGDSGCLYLFHSMATGETKPVMQCM